MFTFRFYLLAAVLTVLPRATWSRADSTIDGAHATRITLPAAGEDPVAFKTPDGKEGWVRRLSHETIPTPAYANGRIYTGGGMISNIFYALDAGSGKTIWQKQSSESGPTSPIVAQGLVAYNTECCDTETRDADTGDLVWHETTGGTLLTQPVVANTVLAIPHPTMVAGPA